MRALLLLLVPASAAAGGWTQPAGESYLKIHNRLLLGERGYDRTGKAHDTGGTYRDWQLVAYGEVGLTDRLTLVAFGAPAGYAAFEDAADARGRAAGSTFYVGALGAGLRAGLAPLGPVHLAAELRASGTPPVGDVDVGAGTFECTRPPCDRFRYTPVIPGVSGELEGQIGVGLPGGFWLSAAAGGRVTTGQDAALIGRGQLGWQGPLGLVLEAHLSLLHPLGTIDESVISGAGETAYRGQGLSVAWWMTPAIAVNAGTDGARGVRSNAAAPTRTLGVELRPALLFSP
ncbi:MAG: hypothetical protein H6706_23400 [Myxococcales bacterium]|nr:hypothetical protein [Myxococcales bacterium]